MQCIDDGDHRFEFDALAHVRIGEKRLQYRRGIGKARGLDDQPLHPVTETSEQIAHARDEIRADRAAHATVVDFDDGFFVGDDQLSVDTYFAELVHDDADLHRPRRVEDAIDECRLTGAESRSLPS